MKISVALCTYNGERYIEQQLLSIFYQTMPINEVILCDDLSNDRTVEIVKRLQLSYNQIKLYTNEENLGVVRNFEKAINLCSGDVVFLSDQDDVWIDTKVEKIMRKFRSDPKLEAIFSDGEIIDNKGHSINKKLFNEFSFSASAQNDWMNGSAFYDLVYTRNIITGATLAIKKSLFAKAYPFFQGKKIWHDGWLGIHSAANMSLGWITEPLIKYRVHEFQQIGIGNGVVFSKIEKKIPLRRFLMNLKDHNRECLRIITEVLKIYPDKKNDLLDSEAMKWIEFCDLRLHLPPNLIKRIFVVLSNAKIYQFGSPLPFKSIIRDIIRPC